jgi:putative GTP pyrophosphokinase
MEAQQLFEDNSNIVSRILNGIQELYFYHRVREAVQFQFRFNEHWETEDVRYLKELSMEIDEAIARAKKG